MFKGKNPIKSRNHTNIYALNYIKFYKTNVTKI